MRVFILLTFFQISLICSFAQINGKAVAITDGDTFTLLDADNKQIKIRLHGIDCPEGGQDFGNRSKQHLSQLIFSKEVVVDNKGLDRYGRTIGIVYLDSLNVNEEMLRSGMAWHFKRYDKNKYWAGLEIEAREKKLGLWFQENPTAPWDWRSSKKK